jgi:hypothetical protein
MSVVFVAVHSEESDLEDRHAGELRSKLFGGLRIRAPNQDRSVGQNLSSASGNLDGLSYYECSATV